jgi:hypothetical protein
MSDRSKGLIKYTSRDYNSIVEEFWNLVPKLTELWKPEADADPGVVLGKYLASIADMLGVNLDWLANEIFGPSVTQRKNAEKIFGLVGYTLGWYTAARTEVTFVNNLENPITLDFGFNGENFCTLNAYTDITQQPRVITYNILPRTSEYGAQETRSKREIIASAVDTFEEYDQITLQPGEKVTRVAIEGELRQVSYKVSEVKNNNYIIKLPSQHIDTTAVWMKARTSLNFSDGYERTNWKQVASASEFVTPEPRFAVTYDNYSNAQIQVSNYLNQLENYNDNYLTVYWIECSGAIGSVSENVLGNFQPAKPAGYGGSENPTSMDGILISNLSNTTEIPHTHTVTGKSPETAKEAYVNSRNYVNTWDSLITIPDYNRFIKREPGIDCGTVIDCQKALEINLAIYKNKSLTDAQKSKMYITYHDFPENETDIFDWENILKLGFDPEAPNKFVFSTNFKTYTAMCFAIYNDFESVSYGQNTIATINKPNPTWETPVTESALFKRYKLPGEVITGILRDYAPIGAMSVELQFGYARIFPWYVVGEIYPKNPVSSDVASNIIARVKEALALYFSPANREFGQKPTIMEVVDVIENADNRIKYFDAGGLNNPVIVYKEFVKNQYGNTMHIAYDIEYFNPISFAQYKDPGALATNPNLRIAPDWVLSK